MVVNKNGFDPFHKDAFGPTIDPSLFVPHSPATDSLFSIQCKLHLFCVKVHLGIPFHPTICVCVCFLIPVLISPIWEWTFCAFENLVFVWSFGCFDLWVLSFRFFSFKFWLWVSELGYALVHFFSCFVVLFCWSVEWYICIISHGICFIKLQFFSVWCWSKCINWSTIYMFITHWYGWLGVCMFLLKWTLSGGD